MRCIAITVIVAWTYVSLGGINTYNELISSTIQACDTPELLLTESFTNDVVGYRAVCTNVHEQCAADLTLAISLMHRVEHDEGCVGNNACFLRHQSLVSNIVYHTGLAAGVWIRYAAAVEYMSGLNYDNQQVTSFILSTNMLAKIEAQSPDMGVSNYWMSMSRWMKIPNETLPTVFRLNAAIWLAEHNRGEEVGAFTNSLPVSAINMFLDDIK